MFDKSLLCSNGECQQKFNYVILNLERLSIYDLKVNKSHSSLRQTLVTLTFEDFVFVVNLFEPWNS